MGLFSNIGNFFKKATNKIGDLWNSSKATIGDTVATTSDIIKKVPGLLVDALPNEGRLGQIKKAYGVASVISDKAPQIFDKLAGTTSRSML
jgi:hypothetical protein